MSERTGHAPGTPSWVDLGSPDIDASVEFYGALFGWDIPEPENAEATGGYRMAMLSGKAIAGMAPLMQEGQPPAWQCYVAVEDADAATEAVRDAGGQVIVEPMDVLDAGRMAVFGDPSGAAFAVWQSGAAIGSELVNQPGAFSWAELNTRDVEAAKAFYGAVFGWTFQTDDLGEAGTYTTVNLDGRPVAGILDQNERGVPDGVPAHWQVYFAVEDTDAAIEKAKAAGASVMVEPIEVPAGRFAILTDPHGVAFAVIALAEPA